MIAIVLYLTPVIAFCVLLGIGEWALLAVEKRRRLPDPDEEYLKRLGFIDEE